MQTGFFHENTEHCQEHCMGTDVLTTTLSLRLTISYSFCFPPKYEGQNSVSAWPDDDF